MEPEPDCFSMYGYDGPELHPDMDIEVTGDVIMALWQSDAETFLHKTMLDRQGVILREDTIGYDPNASTDVFSRDDAVAAGSNGYVSARLGSLRDRVIIERRDAMGNVQSAEEVLVIGMQAAAPPKIVRHATGFASAWPEVPAGGGNPTLRFALLDDNGAVQTTATSSFGDADFYGIYPAGSSIWALWGRPNGQIWGERVGVDGTVFGQGEMIADYVTTSHIASNGSAVLILHNVPNPAATISSSKVLLETGGWFDQFNEFLLFSAKLYAKPSAGWLLIYDYGALEFNDAGQLVGDPISVGGLDPFGDAAVDGDNLLLVGGTYVGTYGEDRDQVVTVRSLAPDGTSSLVGSAGSVRQPWVELGESCY
jgi:hypothetical protein